MNRYLIYLPETIHNNLFEQARVDKALTELAHIHTDLIYWYIEHLNNGLSSDRFLQIKRYYLKQKHAWLLNAIEYIRKNTKLDSATLISVFHPYRLQQNLSAIHSFSDIKINVKRMNYLTVKYFAPTWQLAYDSTFNYEPVLQQLQAARRTLILQRTEHGKGQKQLDEIINHWYLFNNNQALKEKAYQHITKILQRYQTKTNWLKSGWNFAIGAGYQQYLARTSGAYVLDFTFLNLEESFKLKGGGGFAEIEYLYRPHSAFLKSFYYLRTNIQFFTYVVKNRSAEREGKYYYKQDIYDFHENLKYTVQLKDWQTFGVILKSTFPLYLGKRIFAIEFGALTEILNHQYTIIYDYYFKRIKGYWGTFYGKEYYETTIDFEKEDMVKTKRSKTEYRIFPILRIHLFLIKNWQLEVTGGRNYLTLEFKTFL